MNGSMANVFASLDFKASKIIYDMVFYVPILPFGFWVNINVLINPLTQAPGFNPAQAPDFNLWRLFAKDGTQAACPGMGPLSLKIRNSQAKARRGQPKSRPLRCPVW
jgi:hypothetical protein